MTGDGGIGVLVMGMHRSGTSVVAKILAELGCDLGGEVIDAKPDNPAGYWEHRDVVLIHEEFLCRSRRTWSDPTPLSRGDFDSRPAAEARSRLLRVFKRDFQSRPLWLVKDPRLCLLAPLWNEVFDAFGGSIRIVLPIRSPFSVAESLRRRDGIQLEKGLLLWLRHILAAERFSRGFQRATVHLEDLENNPSDEFLRLGERLGIADRLAADRTDEVVNEFFNPQHVHSRVSLEEADRHLEVHPWISRCAAALREIGGKGNEEAQKELDSVRNEIHQADALLVGQPTAWASEIHNERYARLYSELERVATDVRAEVGATRSDLAVQIEETRLLRESLVGATRSDLAVQIEETRLLRESFEKNHVQLLSGSLHLLSGIEDRWRVASRDRDSAREELDELRDRYHRSRTEVEATSLERDAAVAERHRLSTELAKAAEERPRLVAELKRLGELVHERTVERDQAHIQEDALRGEVDRLQDESVRLQEDAGRLQDENERLQTAEMRAKHFEEQLHETISTRSWRYTSAVRRMWSTILGRGRQ